MKKNFVKITCKAFIGGCTVWTGLTCAEINGNPGGWWSIPAAEEVTATELALLWLACAKNAATLSSPKKL